MITKFSIGTAVDVNGNSVPAYGFEHGGNFIVNARMSACGRFYASPADYGLTNAEADQLERLNCGRDLMAYWEI